MAAARSRSGLGKVVHGFVSGLVGSYPRTENFVPITGLYRNQVESSIARIREMESDIVEPTRPVRIGEEHVREATGFGGRLILEVGKLAVETVVEHTLSALTGVATFCSSAMSIGLGIAGAVASSLIGFVIENPMVDLLVGIGVTALTCAYFFSTTTAACATIFATSSFIGFALTALFCLM